VLILLDSSHPDSPARQALAHPSLFPIAFSPDRPQSRSGAFSVVTRTARLVHRTARKLLYERRLPAELGLAFGALRHRAVVVYRGYVQCIVFALGSS
jgi:hypothetical protein